MKRSIHAEMIASQRWWVMAALLGLSQAACAQRNGMGYWETPAHSVVRVEPCGGTHGADVCLRVAKLPPDAPGGTDTNNPDAGLRRRALCGLVVGIGFHQDEPGKLSGGHLYDPKTGHTYQGTITIVGDSLHLRGYLGISLFGRSETWTRVGPVAACP